LWADDRPFTHQLPRKIGPAPGRVATAKPFTPVMVRLAEWVLTGDHHEVLAQSSLRATLGCTECGQLHQLLPRRAALAGLQARAGAIRHAAPLSMGWLRSV